MNDRAPYAPIAWSPGRACRDFAGAGALHFRCYQRRDRYRHFFVHAVLVPAQRVFSSVLHRFHMHVSASYSSLPCRFTRQNSDGFSSLRYRQDRDANVCHGANDAVAAPRLFLCRHLIEIPTGRQRLTRRFQCCDERNPRFGLHAIGAAKCRNWNVSG